MFSETIKRLEETKLIQLTKKHNNVKYEKKTYIENINNSEKIDRNLKSKETIFLVFVLPSIPKQVLRSTILSSTIVLVFFDNARIGRF